MPKDPASSLLEWYAAHRRDLPWRRDRDPYKVLVSELMLQQTTVETAAPYFVRFVGAWPDVASLAAADEREVLAAWSGLGYYSRARHLLEAARVIVAVHGGRVPEDRQALRTLPGIGPYTASAVAAIAYDRPEIALDGNLRRVLARFGGVEADPRSTAGEKRLVAIGRDLVERADPSSINQALMDLGATICTPRSPRCLLCPLSEGCEARRRGLTETIPAIRTRPRTIEVRLAALVLSRGRRRLIHQRAGPLMRGLCELPLVSLAGYEPSASGRQAARLFEAALGLAPPALEHVGRVRHAITHHRIVVEVYVGVAWLESRAGTGPRRGRGDPAGLAGKKRATAGDPAAGPAGRIAEAPRPGSLRWVEAASLASLPLTGITRKILKLLDAPPPRGAAARPALRSGSGRASSDRRGPSGCSGRRGSADTR